LWFSATITAGFAAELRNSKHRSLTWTIREGRAVKFQQYLDTLQIARDSGAASGGKQQ
jgi:hypothetical protein